MTDVATSWSVRMGSYLWDSKISLTYNPLFVMTDSYLWLHVFTQACHT